LQGDRKGLFVVTVIVTVWPASPDAGVYVNEKGEELADEGLTEPCPSVEIVTCVALPPKTLLVTVTGTGSHVVPLAELRFTVGGSEHCF
jgi:hypothetical protein